MFIAVNIYIFACNPSVLGSGGNFFPVEKSLNRELILNKVKSFTSFQSRMREKGAS